ncbi:MAG TPA: hypothetical protein VLJ62_32185 [Burkholderiaceae bacterium]|nr:hypothetical protein [Burkholderiaceae bacterium]
MDKVQRLDRFYELLPAIIRRRDVEQGQPLRALLQLIASQAMLIEDDLDRLYDNWFIETCEPWVVPYIADLVGHRPLDEDAAPAAGLPARNALLLPRREVAHTLRHRRRKGTLLLLEQLARDVAGWPALAVEFSRRLAQTPSLRLLHPARGKTVDLRDKATLQRLGSAFDTLAHLPDLRRPTSTHTSGDYAPGSVGVYVWRLKARSVTRARANCREDSGPHCYTFSALGNDASLFNRPRTANTAALHGPLDLPQAITREQFSAARAPGAAWASASPDYYGLAADADGRAVAQSVAIWATGWPDAAVDGSQPVPAWRIIVADLGGWGFQPPRDHLAVDPVRGRFAFPPRQLPQGHVQVSYHAGVVADLGGGEYTRPLQQPAGARLIRVSGTKALRAALAPWQRHVDDHGLLVLASDQPAHAVIEITDSGDYVLPRHIDLAAGHCLQLRAAQHTRPVLRLLDWETDEPDSLRVHGDAGSRFTLDGILLTGRGVRVQGALSSFTVRHTTLVPGWSLHSNCKPCHPSEPSIEVIDSSACIVIEHSIVGSIRIDNDEVGTDPIALHITDSVVDATGTGVDSPKNEAIGAAGSRHAFALLQVARSTVIGRVVAHAIARADDSIFMGSIHVARRQIGCLRFCHVLPGSRTPRRFACQPDGVQVAAQREGQARGDSAAAIAAALEQENQRVRPQFDSLRYGNPTYCRLATGCAQEIVRGAEDESEMGVHHDLHQAQRLANLQQRLDEFSPAGVDAGVLLAD